MFGMRIRIALAEKGVEYEYKQESLPGKSPLLLKLNPVHKQLPILIHNGKPISESLIILQYIDEVWNNEKSPSLLPKDPYARAQTRFWAYFIDKKVQSAGKALWASEGEAKEGAKKEFIQVMRVLEGELGDKLFFGGKEFGFVDLALIPFYCWFEAYEIHGGISVGESCPGLIEWAKRCVDKENVSKCYVDPKKVVDFVSSLRNRFHVQ